MDELQLIDKMCRQIPNVFPYVTEMKPLSKFGRDILPDSRFVGYVMFYENEFASITTMKEARGKIYIVIKDENGDNSLLKCGNDFLQNIGLLRDIIDIQGIMITSMIEPRYDKEKGCWFRSFNIKVRYK